MEPIVCLKRTRGSGRRNSTASVEDLQGVMAKASGKDCRSTEQRVLESHCTFQPILYTGSHRRKPSDGVRQQISFRTNGDRLVPSFTSEAL